MIRLLLLFGHLAWLTAVDTDLTMVQAPRPLAVDTPVEDWPHLLGPRQDLHTRERLEGRWAEGGPRLCWRVEKGAGYATPTIVEGLVLLPHRRGDEDLLDCRELESGSLRWRSRSPTSYRDQFGYNNGPRCSATSDGKSVIIFSAQGLLRCLDLADGSLQWQREMAAEFALPAAYFGIGSTPLIADGQVIVLTGADGGPTVVGLDLSDGSERWRWNDTSGPSYASVLRLDDQIAVFTGGPSKPPLGVVALLDLADGRMAWRFPWRSNTVHSVNAASPVRAGKRLVVTASYDTGTACLELATGAVQWTSGLLEAHWGTPLWLGGDLLIGVHGRHARGANLAALDLSDGSARWRYEHLPGTDIPFGRANLLRSDSSIWCLTEGGVLAELAVDEQGVQLLGHQALFQAPETWTGLAVSRGLLLVTANGRDRLSGHGPEWRCLDLRP